MLNRRSQGAQYLTELSERSVTHRRAHPLLFLLIGLLAFAVLGACLSFVPQQEASPSFLAFADECDDEENCDQETLEEGFGDTEYGTDQEAFDQIIEDLEKEKNGPPDDSILYAFQRHFTLGYMNEGNRAKVADALDWYNDIFKSRKKNNCGNGYGEQGRRFPGEEEGTLYWHNCDVPNLVTEFVQDVAYLFFEPGFRGAATDSSYTVTPWFGYPETMPKDVDQNGPIPVTALEVFGYNLKYTSYLGEWDHVKVMTAARALANFGFLDKLKLGAQALLNGILGGVDSAVNGLLDDLKSGNIVRIITSPVRVISNLFGGGASATIDTVIDTSDTNVFATMSWYRPEFGATLYNARQLSNDEIVDYIQGQLAAFLASIEKDRDTADPPSDLTSIDPDRLAGLSPPSPGECSGSYTATVSGEDPVVGGVANNTAKATEQGACYSYLSTTAVAAHPGATISWTVRTFVKRTTVSDWAASAKGPMAIVEKYQIFCNLDEADTSTETAPVDAFIECLRNQDYGYPAAVRRETLNEQTTLDQSWFTRNFQEKKIAEFFRKQTASFASPSARYICLNPDGTDMKNGNGEFVKLITGEKGGLQYNEKCAPVRSPIQNGLFGNGYYGEQPPVDTRREAFTPSAWDLIGADGFMSNAGLTVSKFVTQVSNTFLRLAFAPILQELGIDSLIANMIVGFRDGLFFPLSILLIVIGALTAFFQAGVRRDFGAQGKSLLLIVGTFFLGALLMTDPARTIKWVDDAPAYGESVVVGAIFDIGNPRDDNLCNAASEVDSNVGDDDFFGNKLQFDPAASQRTILCENWRVFAFTPYVYGQWGTSYESLTIQNLNAEGDQAKLVGDGQGKNAPYVALGANGSNAERNWGLYQLDALTSGTVTGYDTLANKSVNPNMYRIVDLQAGPGGLQPNAPYDDRYFDSWSGENTGARLMTAWMGAGVSLIGGITIMIFAGAKILLSLMSMLLLLFMPIMFLIGLMPGNPRYKLKTYMLEILSLMVQRVVLVAILALMLRVITAIAQASDNFFYYAVLTAATCLAFLVYRKEILRLFDTSLTGGGSGFKAQDFKEYLPRSLTQFARTRRMMTGHMVTGAAGGFMAGGLKGAARGAKRASDLQQSRGFARNAREGLGGFTGITRAAKAGSAAAGAQASGYSDALLKPVAEQRARERLAKENLPDDVLAARLDKETQEELKALRPTTGAARRNVNRLAAREDDLTTSVDRSPRNIRKEIKQTVQDSQVDQRANLDRMVQRVDELKPQFDATTAEISRYNQAAERVAKDAGQSVVASGRSAPPTQPDYSGAQTREERVQAERRHRLESQQYLQASAQEVMKSVYDETQDRLPEMVREAPRSDRRSDS